MPKQPSISTALKIGEILWPDFVVVNDLIFLKSESPISGDFARWPTKTETEASVNHVHVLDLFSHKAGLSNEPFWDSSHKDFTSACALGKKWAQAIFQKLSHDFPLRRFRVYFTERDNPIVRFHQIHQGEAPWLSEADWQQAILAGEIIIYESQSRA